MHPYLYAIALFLVIHLSFLSLPLTIAAAQVDGGGLVEQGKTLLNSGNYNEALSRLLEAVAKEPENPVAYNYLGEAYYRLKRLDEAVTALKKGISLKPDYMTPHLGLGFVFEAMGDTEGAMGEYREVLKIGEGTPYATEIKIAGERLKRLEAQGHMSRGGELFKKGSYEEALVEVNMAISRDTDNPAAHFIAGLIYKELAKAKEAFSAFKRVTELQPRHVIAHFNIGDLHFTFGAYKEAIEEFSEVVRLSPDSREGKEAAAIIKKAEERIALRVYFDEAAEAVKNEKNDVAEEVLKKILDIEPDNGFALYNIGVVYFKTSRTQEALEALEKSVKINPADPKARLQLGVIYQDLGRLEDAVKEYENAGTSTADIDEVRKAREKGEALKKYMTAKEGAERIEILLESGDTEGALKEVDALLSERGENEEAHLMIGRIYMKKGDREKAIDSLKRAIKLKSDYWDAYILLGQVYEMSKKYGDASELYRAVVSGAPKTKQNALAAKLLKAIEIPIHFDIAKKYMGAGDLEGAMKEIKLILEMAPDDPVALYNAGILFDRLNDPLKAEEYLKKALEKRPDYIQAHLQLALVYETLLEFENATREFNAVLNLDQEGKEASIAKVKLGVIKEEEALLTHMQKAYKLLKKEDLVGAVEELEIVIAIFPDNYMAYSHLGQLLFRLERAEDSINALRRAAELKPDLATAHLYLARVYEKENMMKDAKEEYQKASILGAGTRDGEMADMSLMRLRNWKISGGMGNTMISNISYGAKKTTYEVTGHRMNLLYNIYSTMEKGLIVNVSANRSLYYHIQLSDMTYSGNMSWRHKVREDISYGLNASYTYNMFENKPPYESYSYSANWQHQVRKEQPYSLNASYTYNMFENKPTYESYSYSATTSLVPLDSPYSLSLSYSFSDTSSFINKTSDSFSHALSFSMSQKLSPRDNVSGSFSFSAYVNKDPMGNNYANRSNNYSVSYNRTISANLSAGAGYSIGLINYSNPDSTTLFTQFRRNISRSLSANISYKLSENVSLSLNLSKSNMITNIDVPTADERQRLQNIIAAIPEVGGGYKKETISMNVGVTF